MRLDEYQQRAVGTAVYPGRGTTIGLDYVAHKLAGESGEFAEHFGKALRDDGLVIDIESLDHGVVNVQLGTVSAWRRDMLKKELGDVLWYIAAGAMELGYTLEEIAKANLDKLASRKARGTLGGSGDNR